MPIFYYPYFGYATKCEGIPITFPPQHQLKQPGLEYLMYPPPIFDNPNYKGTGKVAGKVALITGGDSGIGRAVSIAFAKEGADIAIVYRNEHKDAQITKAFVEAQGRRCILICGDLKKEDFCKKAVETTVNTFGHLDILVNNAAVQYPQPGLEFITSEQLEETFRTNIFAYFYVARAALPYLKRGDAIINTASVVAYKGHTKLIDYSAAKGAVVSFTRSLSLSLESKGIRVNAVAPGPIWTPLIPASFSAEEVATFGLEAPMKRAGQPVELAPTYVFLASNDSTYISGQVIHVNGGTMVES